MIKKSYVLTPSPLEKKNIKRSLSNLDESEYIQKETISNEEIRQFETLEAKIQKAMRTREGGLFSARKLKRKITTGFVDTIELIQNEKLLPPLSPIPTSLFKRSNDKKISELKDIVANLKLSGINENLHIKKKMKPIEILSSDALNKTNRDFRIKRRPLTE